MTDRPGGHDIGTGGTWATEHERARTLLAERMYEPLGGSDSGWLDEHLLGCQDCRVVDADYLASREALRALTPPIPPRDLWARTSAALDREEQRTRAPWFSSTKRLAALSRGRTPAGAAVVAVVLVAFVASTVLLPTRVPGVASASTSPGATLGPGATPIAVGAGDVAWFTASGDGRFVLNSSQVQQVCPATAATPCATLEATADNVPLVAVAPRSVYGSPARDQVVVLGRKAGSNTLTMFVMSVAQTQGPKPSPTVRPTLSPTASPTARTSTEPPTPSPSTGTVTPTPALTASPTPSTEPSPTSSIIPGETPSPTAAAVLAIASDLIVVGQTAAYSPDGTWFAFNARRVDAQSGSDIYLWRAGQLMASPITTDGRSVFSGWVGDRLVGSRIDPAVPAATHSPAADGASPSAPGATAAATEAPASDATASPSAADSPAPSSSTSELTATAFLLDPTTAVAVPLAARAWRPVVDPSGRLVVYWDGSVVPDPATGGWIGGTGRLVVGSWPAVAGAALAEGAFSSPGVVVVPIPGGPTASGGAGDAASASPSLAATTPAETDPASPSPDSSTPAALPSAEPSAGPVELPVEVGSADGKSWDAGWDEAGEHLAVWIGDPADPASGRISLVSIDPISRESQTSGPSLLANPALPGFSLSDGHLAWATPPDASGSGSRLQVFAWSGPDAGKIDSQPAGATDTVIVVQH